MGHIMDNIGVRSDKFLELGKAVSTFLQFTGNDYDDYGIRIVIQSNDFLIYWLHAAGYREYTFDEFLKIVEIVVAKGRTAAWFSKIGKRSDERVNEHGA
jgi:hypothetical protein